MLSGMGIGARIDVVPRMAATLKMFDPITLPTAMSASWRAAATTEVAS